MCILCGDAFSWSRMERLGDHMHLVHEADIFGRSPPCGVAINADVDNVGETFLCLACAAKFGGAVKKALRAAGVSA